MGTFVADFETTTNPDNCFVWAYALCDINEIENVEIGTTIDDFMQWCESQKENHKILFHNLRFDSQFIISWLFNNGFKHTSDPYERESRTFNTLISDKSLYYQVEIIFYKRGKNIKKVTIQDSMKLIPLSVKDIAESFKMPIKKLDIDYEAHNNMPAGSELSEREKEYIKHDVQIVAKAIKYFYEQGLTRMTIGGCALEEYKSILQKRNFKRYFPPPMNYYEDLKQSYRGGFTYLNPKFKSKTIGKGVVLDVNSLYPSVMYDSLLPFGTPIYFEGEYEPDPLYPLYTQMIRCQFELKKNKIPTIQIRWSSDFAPNEYLTSSNNQEQVLCLNSVDLELFFENYDVYNPEFISGWKFRATTGLFNAYIDKWNGIKIKAKEEGNHGLYLIAKLMLNSLYGKFGTDIRIKSKIPYLNKEGVVCYKDSPVQYQDGVYIAMASFITSYARRKTIHAAQKIIDDYNNGKSKLQFVYADTDSLHLYSPDHSLPEGLEIDKTKLGAWKFETKFRKGKYLRQKCYMEDSTEDVYNENAEYKYKITVAGMPEECYQFVDFDNFEFGTSYKGKKQPEIVRGGVILRSIDFTIKE